MLISLVISRVDDRFCRLLHMSFRSSLDLHVYFDSSHVERPLSPNHKEPILESVFLRLLQDPLWHSIQLFTGDTDRWHHLGRLTHSRHSRKQCLFTCRSNPLARACSKWS